MISTYTSRAIIVIPASEQAAANAWMKANIDPEGGERTFDVALVDDVENVTSYWCSIACTSSQYQLMNDHFGEKMYDGNSKRPDDILVEKSLDTPDIMV